MIRVIMLILCLVCVPLTAWANPHNNHHPSDRHRHHESQRFTIDISSNHGGNVTPRGHLSLHRGESVSVHIRPHKGYRIERVIVDGRNIGPVREYTFSHVRRSHKIFVDFTPVRHKRDQHHGHWR